MVIHSAQCIYNVSIRIPFKSTLAIGIAVAYLPDGLLRNGNRRPSRTGGVSYLNGNRHCLAESVRRDPNIDLKQASHLPWRSAGILKLAGANYLSADGHTNWKQRDRQGRGGGFAVDAGGRGLPFSSSE